MSTPQSATPLFVDTSGFFAQVYARDTGDRHDLARQTFRAIEAGELPFRPLYTSGYVLSELATLLGRKTTHERAVEGLRRAADSPNVGVLHPDGDEFQTARAQFEDYDDQTITFVDHLSSVLADQRDIDHVLTFDTADFHTLGFTCVPSDVRVP